MLWDNYLGSAISTINKNLQIEMISPGLRMQSFVGYCHCLNYMLLMILCYFFKKKTFISFHITFTCTHVSVLFCNLVLICIYSLTFAYQKGLRFYKQSFLTFVFLLVFSTFISTNESPHATINNLGFRPGLTENQLLVTEDGERLEILY